MGPIWIVLIILAALALLAFVLSLLLAAFSIRIKKQTLEEALQWQRDHFDLRWYDSLEKENYLVACDDGYQLHVQRLVNPTPTGRCVIISHGYTDNRYGALKYAKLYLDRGYDVIVYDLRGHGENKNAFCTYSVRESRDLAALIRDTRNRLPGLKRLGLHGESLGGATTIACLSCHPDADFAVSDCGFSEITSVMQGGLRAMHLPAWLVYPASACAKLLCGYSFGQMRPVDSLPGTTMPILFLHGAADDFILPAHARTMHRVAEDHSTLHLIPGAGHAGSILTAPEDYRRYLWEFLDSIDC